MAEQLTETLDADGPTTLRTFLGATWLHLSGDFGGGTATFRFRDASGVMQPFVDGVFTAAVDQRFNLPDKSLNTLQVTLAGATAPDLLVNIQDESG